MLQKFHLGLKSVFFILNKGRQNKSNNRSGIIKIS